MGRWVGDALCSSAKELTPMPRKSQPWPPPNVRLVATGTRVLILKGPMPYAAGVISEHRTEPYLKSYVVTRDDGQVVYASAYDLALETDAKAVPLGVRSPDDW
jgi:hypothetical protein